jgi:transglutaminase-like putative cysteine protease
VLPPGFQRGEINCASCNTGLVFGTSARRSSWPTVIAGVAMLALAAVGAVLLISDTERMGRVTQLVRDVRAGGPSEAVPATPDGDPLPPSTTPGGPSDEEESIRVHDVPDVLAAIDPSNATTRDLAVQVAAQTSGVFSVEQVADIWTYVRVRWNYVNDPRGAEYFARASETITNQFAGDCDDFATTLSAMTQAIGGNARVVMMDSAAGGHAYTEVCIDLDPTEIATRLAAHFRRHWDRRLGRQTVHDVSYRSDAACRAWVNLDWNAPVPGGPYGDETWAVAIFADGHTETLTPARAPADAGVRHR